MTEAAEAAVERGETVVLTVEGRPFSRLVLRDDAVHEELLKEPMP